ncbi:MAG: hypothetical protein HKO59_06990 [Phycisphaerales bacterium]|nr:hypothetical protein [Phycisphaerales bacterium]NNM25721.1 hypothetical protein [Phycisphaerales bacterium]
MSRLLARIMLALLMLPLGAVVYGLSLAVFLEYFLRGSEEAGFALAHVMTITFIVSYWVLLWRGTVRWNATRLTGTIGAGALALLAGSTLGASVSFVDPAFGVFVGGIVSILLWLVATVFLWRETAGERRARVRARGVDTIVCPVCGYNMTGLGQSACPECGSRFTISELMALQREREGGEIGAG